MEEENLLDMCLPDGGGGSRPDVTNPRLIIMAVVVGTGERMLFGSAAGETGGIRLALNSFWPRSFSNSAMNSLLRGLAVAPGGGSECSRMEAEGSFWGCRGGVLREKVGWRADVCDIENVGWYTEVRENVLGCWYTDVCDTENTLG